MKLAQLCQFALLGIRARADYNLGLRNSVVRRTCRLSAFENDAMTRRFHRG